MRRERDRPQDEAGKPMAVMLALFALCFTLPVAAVSVKLQAWAPGFEDGGLTQDGWTFVAVYAGVLLLLCAVPFTGAWWLRRRLSNERRFAATRWTRIAMLTAAGALAFASIWVAARVTAAVQAPAVHVEALTDAQLREAAFSAEPGLRIRALNWGERWQTDWLDAAMLAALDAESALVRRRGLRMYWEMGWLVSLRSAWEVYADSTRIAKAIGALEHDGPLQQDILALMKRQMEESPGAEAAHVVKMLRWVGDNGRDPVPSRERVRICEAILWCGARDLHLPAVRAEFEALARIDDLHDECHTWVTNSLTKYERSRPAEPPSEEGK